MRNIFGFLFPLVVMYSKTKVDSCNSKCPSTATTCLDSKQPVHKSLGIEHKNLCYRKSDCFGLNSTDIIPVQQIPVQILENQHFLINVSFLLSGNFTFSIVQTSSYDAFASCNQVGSRNVAYIQRVDGLLQVQNLTQGKSFLLFFTNHQLYDCNFGFRVQVDVYQHKCFVNNQSICSDNGRCLLKDSGHFLECSCCHGYTGEYCEEFNSCSVNKCLNNGTCYNIKNGSFGNSFNCSCLPQFTGQMCEACAKGFTGSKCEQDVDECHLKKTVCNFGKCVNSLGSFNCVCPKNVTGLFCETDLYDNCQSGPCSSNSTCVDMYNDYECMCPMGFTGKNCNNEINECASQPCSLEGTDSCIDLVGGFSCKCIQGFTGNFCEIDIDECSGKPCLNGALCLNQINDYKCICQPGFDGKNCQNIANKCQVLQPCENNSTCYRCGHNLQDYGCDCLPGWSGRNCSEETNECLSQPCLNNASCTDLFNKYSCSCLAGWTGVTCDVNIDMCKATPCENNSTCVDSLVGLEYSCLCQPGFTSTNCSVNIDDCQIANVSCNNGKCIDLINGFRCQCDHGWYGEYCDADNDLCALNPCVNSLSCENVNTTTGYRCKCKPGFTGVSCVFNIDDCVNNACQNGAVCADLINGYNCSCPPGFYGTFCENKTNECQSNPCKNNATCLDLVNQFFCECKPGFNGTTCENNINECFSAPCKNNGTCVDGNNSFHCICATGFTSADCSTHQCDLPHMCENNSTCMKTSFGHQCLCSKYFTGIRCESSINECLFMPCKNNATCNDLREGYQCECKFPYSGDNCKKHLCDCNICRNGAPCRRSPDNYECLCKPGYTGQHCEQNINECSSNRCSLNGTSRCRDLVNDYSCVCNGGYTGKFCETHICDKRNLCNNGTCLKLREGHQCVCIEGFTGNSCEHNIDDCRNVSCGSGKCIDKINDYVCLCPVLASGKHCEIDLDFCFKQPCLHNTTCVNIIENGTFTCDCGDYYIGRHCEMHVCNVSNPCTNGSCITKPNGFDCSCSDGFTGKYCETNINECTSGPCLNRGECVDGLANFSCICPKNFTGLQCEHNVDYCTSFPCHNNGTCKSNYTAMTYICKCLPSFFGTECHLHECDVKNPCRNNGTCLRTASSPRCQCLSGYTAPDCSVEVNECISNPCLNEGKCIDLVNSYECVCSKNFTGRDCGIYIDYCSNSSCLNGGTCINNLEKKTFYCQCPDGYTGKKCEIRVNGPCKQNPCDHNGKCFEVTNATYKCECRFAFEGKQCEQFKCPCRNGRCIREGLSSQYSCICFNGFSGPFCEKIIGDCRNHSDSSVRCTHQSFCQNTSYGFVCVCPSHLQGRQCDIAGGCRNSTCLNHAVCNGKNDTYKCNCLPGFSGRQCEFDINECLSVPCKNNGLCAEDGINNFKCYCQSGFNGTNCEQSIVSVVYSSHNVFLRTLISSTRSIITRILNTQSKFSSNTTPTVRSSQISVYYSDVYTNIVPSIFTKPSWSLSTRLLSTGSEARNTMSTYLDISTFIQMASKVKTSRSSVSFATSMLLPVFSSPQPMSTLIPLGTSAFESKIPNSSQSVVSRETVETSISQSTIQGPCLSMISNSKVEIKPSGTLLSSQKQPQTTASLSKQRQISSSTSYIRFASKIESILPNRTVTVSHFINDTQNTGYFTSSEISGIFSTVTSVMSRLFFTVTTLENTAAVTTLWSAIMNETISHGKVSSRIPMISTVISSTQQPTTFPSTTQKPFLNLTCADKPCSGYQCIDEINNNLRFRCVCPFPTVGPRCIMGASIHYPRFNGHSFIELTPVHFNQTSNEIVMMFHTVSANGLLLYTNHSIHKDFLKISIVDGFLVFSLSTGAESFSIRSHSKVNTGHNVLLQASINSLLHAGTLRINNKETISRTIPSSLRHVDVSSSWYLGGIPFHATFSSFVGCMKKFQVNGKPFSISDPNQVKSWLSISECDVSACERGACHNNATCVKNVNDANKYKCICQSGFFGTDCRQTINHCATDPCNGQGECLWTPIGYHCLCNYGKVGKSCLIDTVISMPEYSLFKNRSSYIEYPAHLIAPYALERFEIRLQFKLENGKAENALLAYVGQSTIGALDDDFFAVGIFDRYLMVLYNLGDGIVQIRSTNTIDTSRRWHFVVAGRSRQHGYLYFDSHQKVSRTGPGKFTGLNVNTPLYLGGYPDFTNLPFMLQPYFKIGFSGIIHDAAIRTNGKGFVPLLTLTTLQVSQNMIGIPVDHGLNINDAGEDQCKQNPCANNGTCVRTGSSFTCNCLFPYKGSLCYEKSLSCLDYNPCSVGSTCHSDGNLIRCDCPFGYKGLYCTERLFITYPYFKSRSYISFPRRRIRSYLVLNLKFRSEVENGLLFYVARDLHSSKGDFMAISIWQRYVYVRFNLGSNTASMRTRKKIALYKFHALYVRWARKDAIMKLDNNYLVGVRTSGQMVKLDVTTSFYLGGVPFVSAVNHLAVKNVQTQHDFVGCIASFVVNGHAYNLSTSNTAIRGRNVLDCSDVHCKTRPCFNNGECLVKNSTYSTCNCILGTTGSSCQRVVKPFTSGSFGLSSYWLTRASYLSSSVQASYLLTFKTWEDGLLLWHGKITDHQSDLLVVGIQNGKVNLSLVLEGHESTAVIEESVVDGQFHTLRVNRIANTVQFIVNGHTPRIVHSSSTKTTMNNDGYLFLGGLPGDVAKTSFYRYKNGFTGCITDVTYTGREKPVDFASTENAHGMNVKPCSF